MKLKQKIQPQCKIANQLRFQILDFVNAGKPLNQLHEASKKYYKDRNKLKNNNYVNCFG